MHPLQAGSSATKRLFPDSPREETNGSGFKAYCHEKALVIGPLEVGTEKASSVIGPELLDRNNLKR